MFKGFRKRKTPAMHAKVPKKYSFSNENKWKHYDGVFSKGGHFVMHGGFRKPLVILQYDTIILRPNRTVIRIYEIQRTSKRNGFFNGDIRTSHLFDLAKKRKVHKKAQTELNMHTSEFILREFIFRHKEKLMDNSVELEITPPNLDKFDMLPYQTLINRYFVKIGPNHYVLSKKKKRVKELLN